ITSSPGFQRVTPSPTFQTIPEASEPPMWWSSSWAVNTDTGWPSAAHTLLKFTPAAITRTVTSKAAGSGTSISSSWNASIGSPWRSSRITHAAMVAGSSPGSTSISATRLVSTAMGSILTCNRPPASRSEPVVALEPHHDAGERRDGQGQPEAQPEEVVRGVDVADQPAEVLPEEPCEDRPGDEHGAEDRQARRHRVEAVGVGVEVGAGERVEVVGLARQLARDLREVVADVAQVLVRALAQTGQLADRVRGGQVVIALRARHPQQLTHVLAQPVDRRQLLAARPQEHFALERVDLPLQAVDDGVIGVRQRVEDLVDEEALVLRRGLVQRGVERVQRLALVTAHGDHEGTGEVDVHLDQLRDVVAHPRRVVDEQQVIGVEVDLRPLTELLRVLHGHRVEVEQLAHGVEIAG